MSAAQASLLCNPAPLCPGQVKKALCVLIQHNLVTYQLQKRGFVEYEAQCKRVLRILRYPRYIYTAKTLYSDTGELIVEELLLNGKMTMSAVVRKVADRLTETMEGGNPLLKKGSGSGRGAAAAAGHFCWVNVAPEALWAALQRKAGRELGEGATLGWPCCWGGYKCSLPPPKWPWCSLSLAVLWGPQRHLVLWSHRADARRLCPLS